MKNLNIFSLITEYENTKSEGLLITPNVSFVNEDSSVRYLLKNVLTHNGYEYVDLGLPSGVKWATCNVGANSPEECGLYFAWGETTGYTADDVISGVRIFGEESYTASDISTDLTLYQDAAHVNLGGNWRMPTYDEYQELLDNCNGVWTDDYNGTGVAGRVFTSKVNGNSIFFPAAGSGSNSSIDSVGSYSYYWSASYASEPDKLDWLFTYAYEFNFGSKGQYIQASARYYGYSVRAVCE